ILWRIRDLPRPALCGLRAKESPLCESVRTPQSAPPPAPLWERGAFWEVALPYEVALSQSLLFPEGKRGARRPPPVAETGRSKPSKAKKAASELANIGGPKG